jgi:hypothetical protein
VTQIQRLRVAWSSSNVVGPGLSTFYCSTAGDNLSAGVKAFFTGLASTIAGGTTITIPNFGELIEDTTGDLAGSWSSSPADGGTVTATGSGSFASGVGLRVVWNTSGIHAGRKVRGSTFVVPISSSAFEGAAFIVEAVRANVLTAANGLITAVPSLRILSLPTVHSGVAVPGQSSTVTAALVPDKVSWLRSRRT